MNLSAARFVRSLREAFSRSCLRAVTCCLALLAAAGCGAGIYVPTDHLSDGNIFDEVVKNSEEVSDQAYERLAHDAILAKFPAGTPADTVRSYFEEIGAKCMPSGPAVISCTYHNYELIREVTELGALFGDRPIAGGSKVNWSLQLNGDPLTEPVVRVTFSKLDIPRDWEPTRTPKNAR